MSERPLCYLWLWLGVGGWWIQHTRAIVSVMSTTDLSAQPALPALFRPAGLLTCGKMKITTRQGFVTRTDTKPQGYTEIYSLSSRVFPNFRVFWGFTVSQYQLVNLHHSLTSCMRSEVWWIHPGQTWRDITRDIVTSCHGPSWRMWQSGLVTVRWWHYRWDEQLMNMNEPGNNCDFTFIFTFYVCSLHKGKEGIKLP